MQKTSQQFRVLLFYDPLMCDLDTMSIARELMYCCVKSNTSAI